MKSMIKDAIILLLITLIAGAALGYVNYITEGPIALAEENAKKAAYREVFEDADAFEIIADATPYTSISEWGGEGFSNVKINEVLNAKDSEGNVLGYVLGITTSEGYGGDITFTLGISSDGTITGVSILSISETAGLGMKAPEVLVPQFDDKVSSYTVTKTGATSDAEIDAISGATITSKAVTNAVNAGLFYFNTELGGGADEG